MTNDLMLIESLASAPDPEEAVPMLNVIRIDHVSLNAADRPRTLDWYAEGLGLDGNRHDRLAEPRFVRPDRAQLGIFGDEAPGLKHIAIATDDASQRALIQRLDAPAVPYTPERHRSSFSIYFADPDGARLEVLVPTA